MIRRDLSLNLQTDYLLNRRVGFSIESQSIQQAQNRFSDLALFWKKVVDTDLMPLLMPSSDLMVDS
ncbi:hypothetical protein AG4045_028065 [Apium graveolens]|uniref:Uncharacterized protein n=1 Tax=Apium graveolens TaxID=4045 RepID=A0A6L5BD97_APIGR|nr:hypothetical protein AG4045_028065 [Apium graveolens]